MTLADFADVAEVIGALGVIAGLIFVGVQLRQNTKQMRRAEAAMAMEHGSSMRHMLMENRETAELIVSGVSGAPLDPIDELRLNAFFSEIIFMSMHVWDRVRNDLTASDELSRGIVPTITPLITSARGSAWWARSRATFRADFVTDFEALLPVLKPQGPAPSVTAPQGPETAVAPPADAG